jgi:hypothetical protein
VERITTWWGDVLGVPATFGDGAWGLEEIPGAPFEYLVFDSVPEPKTAKNRVHLDLRAAAGLASDARSDALEAECTRLVALGARRQRRLEADGINEVCIVMEDPEGNEFCLD